MQRATPATDVDQRIAAAVAANRDELIALSMAIHANPELGFQEHAASALVADTLRKRGYEVEQPAGSTETAIRARLPRASRSSRTSSCASRNIAAPCPNSPRRSRPSANPLNGSSC